MSSTNSNVAAPRNARDALQRRYAVIGAGCAGLAAAKYLLQSGFEDVTIFEAGSQIGGLWVYNNDSGMSSAYRTLHINTARNITNFSDHEFAEGVQMFPDHKDMHEYLKSYVNRFDLTRRIRFNARVTGVFPAEGYRQEDPQWEVRLESGTQERFDRVIVASGHLHKPMHVPEFREGFKGEYLHSHYYREPEPFVGKRVCVIGAGNSACDIASDICVNTPLTVMVARSGVMIAPKLIFGHAFTDVTLKLYQNWIPDKLRRWIIGFLVRLIHGRMTDLGFKPMTSRAHPTTSAVVVQHIAYRRIIVKQGIKRIEDRRVFFDDGSSEEFDTMIACTGYKIELPFISPSVVEVKDNAIDLYKRICPPGWSGLYFVGMLNATTSLNWVFEHQSRWICEVERGEAALPTPEEMRQDIEAKRQWIAKYYKVSPRHTIEEEHLVYFNELAKSSKEGRRRMKRLRRKHSTTAPHGAVPAASGN